MLPKPRADLSPTLPTSRACRSSSRPAFASTTRAGCSRTGDQPDGRSRRWAWAWPRCFARARRAKAHRRRPRLPLLFGRREAGPDRLGLLAGGCEVHDIGLALSPMAYFAQFDLDVAGVAMVTASHNENGWTGVKMGAAAPADLRPRRDGPAEGDRARRRVQAEAPAAATSSCPTWPSATSPTLTDRPKLTRR